VLHGWMHWRHLTRSAFHDHLTGLLNRRSFDQALDTHWAVSRQDNTSLAVILLDVDCFKAYNDTYGHSAGDQVLSKLGGVLQAAARRRSDIAARIGGEEFALLLPHADKAHASEVAEQIRRAVQALAIPHERSEAERHVTISLGVVCLNPREHPERKTLFDLADDALYQAKRQGRNKVCLAG